VHVVVQLRLFVVGQVSVVVSHLVAEAHLVEGVMRVSERAGGCSCSAGGVGVGMRRELNTRTTHRPLMRAFWNGWRVTPVG
jgi:hypothetical protein